MINTKGNLKLAIEEFKSNNNNAIAHVFEDAKFGNGSLNESVISIKDNYATKNGKTMASSMLLKNFDAGYNADAIQKLIDAGAAIVGKTHLDELALGGTGEYSAFGKINHPTDKDRMPGGSSSGAASTFTKNISVALGSDTGDSVRLPASYVGSVGFKPSYGAVSRYGLFAFASSLDTVSWFTHNVNDSIEVSKVLYGLSENDFSSVEVVVPEIKKTKPSKITLLNFENEISSDVKSNYESLKSKFEEDGIEVVSIDINKELFDLIGVTYSVISYSEAFSNNSNLTGVSFGERHDGDSWDEIIRNSRTEGFGEMVKRRFTLGSFFLLPENQERYFVKAQKIRTAIINFFTDLLKDSLLVYPTATIAPTWKDGKADSWYSDFLAYSNLVGNPAISIPWMESENLPVNISIDAKIYNDKELLSNALYIEDMIGGDNE